MILPAGNVGRVELVEIFFFDFPKENSKIVKNDN